MSETFISRWSRLKIESQSRRRHESGLRESAARSSAVATIAANEISALMAAGSPHVGQLSFVLIGNPNNPVGGILERFPGFYIPFLDVAFNGATPPNSPYPTSIY